MVAPKRHPYSSLGTAPRDTWGKLSKPARGPPSLLLASRWGWQEETGWGAAGSSASRFCASATYPAPKGPGGPRPRSKRSLRPHGNPRECGHQPLGHLQAPPGPRATRSWDSSASVPSDLACAPHSHRPIAALHRRPPPRWPRVPFVLPWSVLWPLTPGRGPSPSPLSGLVGPPRRWPSPHLLPSPKPRSVWPPHISLDIPLKCLPKMSAEHPLQTGFSSWVSFWEDPPPKPPACLTHQITSGP